MKRKLSTKLILLNMGILIVALLLVTLITSALVSSYVRRDIVAQLEAENKVAARIYFGNLRKIDTEDELFATSQYLYRNLADSTVVIYTKNENTDRYRVVFTSDRAIKANDEVKELLGGVTEEDEGELLEFTLGVDKYIAKVNAFREEPNNEDLSIVTMSFIPASQLRAINARILLSIVLVGLLVGLISAAVLGLFSRRLTKPLAVLNCTAKRYANRQFDEKAAVKSRDEIGELAQSVNDMAQSLQKYDAAQRKFFRNMSHELKTPLTAIRGYAEGLQSGVFTDKDATLDIIIEESKRIGDLVENLVYLDKLESGLEPYTFAPTSMNETIIGAIRKVESIAILRDVEIDFVPGDDAALNIDAEKMTRALINILSNCIKYAKDTIMLSTKSMGGRYVIECIDNGDGFEPHVLDSLFNKAVVGKKEGSGLGLSIAREIVQKHGGTLSACNHAALGAQFNIVLPIC